MEPLSTTEIAAMKAWMNEEGKTLRSVASLLGVANPSILAWLKGGGIRPAQRASLMKLITPYLKPADQFPDAAKMIPAEIRPSLRGIYARLCELEDSGDTALPVVSHLVLTWPTPTARPAVKESLTAAPRPKTTPPELRLVRDRDPEPLEVAAGLGRIGQTTTANAREARIHGESMLPDYQPGQIVQLDPLPAPLVLDGGGYVDYATISQHLKDGSDYLLSLGDEQGNTIKRLVLTPPDAAGIWSLHLLATNPIWAEENGWTNGKHRIKFGDHLTIHARVRR